MVKHKPPRRKLNNIVTPIVRIGKRGLTPSLTKEILKQFDKRDTVKVKVLKTALTSEETEGIAQRVAKETLSEIVQLRGHTFTLHKTKRS